MNHNKHNLKEGEMVWLDAEAPNKSQVAIFSFTPNEMFATVYSKVETGGMWQVMTNRLTPIEVRQKECWGHAANFHEPKS